MSSSSSSSSRRPAPLPIPLEDRHQTKPTSLKSFCVTAVAAPLVTLTVLPLSLAYQVGRQIVSSLSSSSDQQQHQSTIAIDSGYKVDPAQIIPHEERTYDVVVLGATGFTGYLAARYLAEMYGIHNDKNNNNNDNKVKWAIAGRSQIKLNQVQQRLAQELGLDVNAVMAGLDTLVVDTTVPSTLPKLVGQTRSIATTAGPFTLYGNHVVEMAAKFGTHYVDITGEVDWVKAMVSQWADTAQATGAKLIPFCGHDSIPWDLCVDQMQQELQDKCGDDLATVTFWDQFRGEAPGGTLATVLNSLEGTSVKAPRQEFDPFLKLPNGSKSAFVVQAKNPSFIARAESPWNADGRQWTGPFVMAAVNGQVVRWSHALRQAGKSHHPSLTYREMQVFPDFPGALGGFLGLATLGTLLLNPITSSLMRKYVLPKPGQGPSMDKMVNKHYLCIFGEGIGVQGNKVECIMYFPRDVGCLDTSRMLVESALCLVKEDKAKLPKVGGGFWTPSTGMGKPLLDRLIQTGTQFSIQVINKEDMAQSKL